MMIRTAIPVSVVALAILGVMVATQPSQPVDSALPEQVQLGVGSFDYRPAGEYRIGATIVDPPVQRIAVPALSIMKYQVSEADYAACMADNACPVIATNSSTLHAQTGVSFADATAYADWFSRRTGLDWRLPTDAEWLRAAGDRANDAAIDAAASGTDPSQRWLQSYRRQVDLRGDADVTAHSQGHYGTNDLGVADIGGNIWEWTVTCQESGKLLADKQTIGTVSKYCGVRAVQGKHRAYVIDFIRDARSGGCGAGVPPDFLGFRLVRTPTMG